jgi:hypothetical protein
LSNGRHCSSQTVPHSSPHDLWHFSGRHSFPFSQNPPPSSPTPPASITPPPNSRVCATLSHPPSPCRTCCPLLVISTPLFPTLQP